MPLKKVEVPGVGEVLLYKRRKAKNVRLSITARGQIKVSLPIWAPYSFGVSFAESKSDWIAQQLVSNFMPPLRHGAKIGKKHQLYFRQSQTPNSLSSKVSLSSIEIISDLPLSDPIVQERAQKACERALKQEALELLPERLDELARLHNLSYKDVKIRRLSARWGSYSSGGTITLSYFLVQLPWEFIDYVLLHELIHTKHLHHGQGFWSDLMAILPQAKVLQKQIRRHKPRVEQG